MVSADRRPVDGVVRGSRRVVLVSRTGRPSRTPLRDEIKRDELRDGLRDEHATPRDDCATLRDRPSREWRRARPSLLSDGRATTRRPRDGDDPGRDEEPVRDEALRVPATTPPGGISPPDEFPARALVARPGDPAMTDT